MGIKGDEIPVECRIFAIDDAYDAMTNDQPYSGKISKEEALEELKRWAGVQFDPVITSLFCELHERIPDYVKD